MERKIINQIFSERKMITIDRLSGTLKNKRYSLAEHSFFVALMFQIFADVEKIEYTVKDMNYIMRHDLIEVLTADLILPVKDFSDKTREAWNVIESEIYSSVKNDYLFLYTDEDLKNNLSGEIYALLKDCDRLELLLFAFQEFELGNSSKDIYDIIEFLNGELNNSFFDFIKKFTIDINDYYNYF